MVNKLEDLDNPLEKLKQNPTFINSDSWPHLNRKCTFCRTTSSSGGVWVVIPEEVKYVEVDGETSLSLETQA